jgi:sec-independent protein translocase protein TatA
MLQNIGLPGMVLIFILAMIVFGPQKLPQLGRSMGQTLREFKKSISEITQDATSELRNDDLKKTEKQIAD